MLLWWLADDPLLGEEARAAVADPGCEVFVSAATVWEVGIKAKLGKLRTPEGLLSVLGEEGFVGLPIDPEPAQVAARLPLYHRDPFDRDPSARSGILALSKLARRRYVPPEGPGPSGPVGGGGE